MPRDGKEGAPSLLRDGHLHPKGWILLETNIKCAFIEDLGYIRLYRDFRLLYDSSTATYLD